MIPSDRKRKQARLIEPMQSGDTRALRAIADLIRTCRNGQKGYCTAVDGVTDANIRDLFQGIAAQRGRFAAELESLATPLREKSSAEGAAPGWVPRSWIHIRSTLGTGNETELLFECGRGEKEAVERYQEALTTRLPAPIEALVRRQYEEVKEAYETLRTLEKLN